MQYEDVDVTGTLSKNMNVAVTESVPGVIDVKGFRGNPDARDGAMFKLVFRAGHQKESKPIYMFIHDAHMAQSCVPEVHFSGNGLLLDGDCEKIVRRKDFFLGQNAPNPVIEGVNAYTTIPFTVSGDKHVSLKCLISMGI